MRRKPEKLPKETEEQRAVVVAITPAKLADCQAWLGSLNQTRNAQKENVAQGTRDAKEMLT